MAEVSQVMSVLHGLGRVNKMWAAAAALAAEVVAARYGQMSVWYEIASGVAGLLATYSVPNTKPKAAALTPTLAPEPAPAVRSPEVIH